jgi:hypothetical protein
MAAEASAMRSAALDFLDSLSPELREQALFPLGHLERRAWSNLPTSMFERKGVSLGEMSPEQAVLAHRLLRSTLSSQGYLKTTGIIYLDEVLRNLASARNPERDFSAMFGQGLYWVGIFGDPRTDAAWGWQLDGHHLALNVTVVGDSISVTPAFMGSDPTEVRAGAFAGWMVQKGEDEAGLALYESLDSRQLKMALIAAQSPTDVVTGPGRGDQLSEPAGLPASQLTVLQKTLLGRLLDEYLGNYRADIRDQLFNRMALAGFENLHFAWAGEGEDKPYYYRIHGPALLIEYTNNYAPGSRGGPVNHIHSVFRLQRHFADSAHHQKD